MDFDTVKDLEFGTKNESFIALKDGKKYFLKRYVRRKGREENDDENMKAELLVYENLKLPNMPKFVEDNHKKRELVLEFEKIKAMPINKKYLDESFKLLKLLQKKNAKYLDRRDNSVYLKSLDARAKEIDLKDWNLVIKKLNTMNLEGEYFSHGDFFFHNLYVNNKGLGVLDFEQARRDNKYFDYATMYLSILDRPKLASYWLSLIKNKNFDQEVFNAMQIRRMVEVLYSWRNWNKMEKLRRITLKNYETILETFI